MAEKKFDAVTVGGLIIAVLMLVGGQWYLQAKRAEEIRQWRLTHPEVTQTTQPVEPAKTQTTSIGSAETKKAEAQTPAEAPAVPEEPTAPDVAIDTDELHVVLTAKGAAISEATLRNVSIDPAKKEHKGLEMLGVIDPAKLSGSIPLFEIGPPEPSKKDERVAFDATSGARKAPNARNWKLASDSQTFDADGKRTVSYTLALDKNFGLTKTFTLYKDRYYVGIDVAVTNNSGAPATYTYQIYGPGGILLDGPKENPKASSYGGVFIRADLAGRSRPAAGQSAESPEVKLIDAATAAKGGEKASISMEENLWGSVKNRFFQSMLISLNPNQLIKLSTVEVKGKPDDSDKRLEEPNIALLATRKANETALETGKTSSADPYAIYVGPSSDVELNKVESQLKPTERLYLTESIQYFEAFNWRWPRVDWLGAQLLWLFHGLTKVVANYGVAVILLTLMIKLALHPTQRKATISMSKMQKLQPELKKIQERYAGQTTMAAKQKMTQETQDLYKKAGVSPAGGCLPMLVQIPILSALYGVFSRAYEIRGAEFLWVKDLSAPDHFMALPFWPNVLNLLPLIYLVLQLVQMKVAPQQPKSDDPQQEMQRKMMSYMPVMFTFMFYGMPAGLMIYFATSAVFSMIEVWYIRKFLIPPASVADIGPGMQMPAKLSQSAGGKQRR
ncbi:MAG TPA: YidC/Oxa1 family insertase periplasmic-domain containing protein [Planctomycetota bacterium]|jgi:YidC/Oxa1 family membrane protein insertase